MRLCCLLLCLLVSCFVYSQSSISIAGGFSWNLNRKPGSTINFTSKTFSLQWIPGHFNKRFAPIIKLDYLPGTRKTSTEHAFTADMNLPAEINVEKSIIPHIINLNAGLRFRIYTIRRHSFYGDALLTALSYQSFEVTYDNYDKEHYEIMNPDVSLKRVAPGLGVGIVYKFSLNDHNGLLCMLHLQSPPFASSRVNKYELTYRLIAPLQATVGYSFSYKKAKP